MLTIEREKTKKEKPKKGPKSFFRDFLKRGGYGTTTNVTAIVCPDICLEQDK
jgi:hypothetical protein